MDKILVLVDQKKNRGLLQATLESSYEVLAPVLSDEAVRATLQEPVQLVIVDGVSLTRYRKQLAARKDAEGVLFLPYLLLTSRSDVGLHTGKVWQLIDEVLLTPVVRAELSVRVRVLLRARRYSLEAADRFSVLAENSPTGIAIEQNGAFVYCNHLCGDIRTGLGNLSEEALLDLLKKVSPGSETLDPDEPAFAAGSGVGEMEVLVEGKHRWIEVRWAQHVYRSRPAILYLLDDVTGRKAAERELILAREHAERMERMKTVFLTNMSHEIRTPLTGIIGYAELLEAEATGEYGEMAEAIHQSGERLLDTLNSVLDLAQLEGNAVQVRPARMDACEVVQDILQPLLPQARKKEIELHVEKPEAPVWMYSDRGLIARILTNLVANAVKFTEKGSVTVAIEREDEAVVFKVHDTGIGIDPETLPRIFDAFQQESTGLSRKYEGSGLGLSIVRGLLSLLDGRIRVQSEVGAGSRFTVVIPVRATVPTTPPAPSRPPLRHGGPKPSRSRVPEAAPTEPDELAILVVDDDVHARRVLTRFLGPDCIVTAVGSAEKAMSLTKEARFNLVIIDIALGTPELGIDLMQRLRVTQGHAQVPIVACTAYALPGDRERLLEMGFDGYVAKPFTKADIEQVLEAARLLDAEL